MHETRKVTCQLIGNAEEGILSWESIARAALCYLSEYDVADMAHINELLPDDEEDNENEDEEEDNEENEEDDDSPQVPKGWDKVEGGMEGL